VGDRPSKEYTGRKRFGGARVGSNKRWRCSCARTVKSKLYRHQIISILRKFHIYLRDICDQNIQKTLTIGRKSSFFEAFFACISMESLFGGVRPSKAHWCYVKIWGFNAKKFQFSSKLGIFGNRKTHLFVWTPKYVIPTYTEREIYSKTQLLGQSSI
jgi:hypothetical protein